MPNKFIPAFYDVGSDIVIIGQNPEMADVDNPRGDIHGLRPYVRAFDKRGNTYIKYSTVTYPYYEGRACEKDAEILAACLNLKLKHRLMPDFNKWCAGRPMYGSEAYIEYGQADDLAWERDMEND